MNPLFKQLAQRVAALEKVVYMHSRASVLQKQITIVETVQITVCEQLDIGMPTLLGERRFSEWVWARAVAMSLAYELSGLGTMQIAPLFNRKNHGTVLHAVRSVRNQTSRKTIKARVLFTQVNELRIIIKEKLQAICPENDWNQHVTRLRTSSVSEAKRVMLMSDSTRTAGPPKYS